MYELVLGTIEPLDLMVNIRKFSKKEVLTPQELIYTSEDGFNYVVAKKCIEDFGDLIHILDKLGYSDQKSPKAIMAELAEMAFEQNPHFRDQKREKPDFSEKTRKSRKRAEIRLAEKRALDDFERFTLQKAKKLILGTLLNFDDSAVAEKLGITENKLQKLKNRNWTFRDCLSIAGKLELDVEIAFGRFSEYYQEDGKGK